MSWAVLSLVSMVLVPGMGTPVEEADARETQCADSEWILAVDSIAGHLVQFESCRAVPGFWPAMEIDTGDWRTYRHLFATGI
jgi:hypothetical protein